MRVTLCFLLIALTLCTEGKSIKQDLTSSQTNKDDLRMKRSVFGILQKRRMEKFGILQKRRMEKFGILHKRRMEKFVNVRDIKTFHKQTQKAGVMKMHIKKHLKSRTMRGELCSVMAFSLKQLCQKINWNVLNDLGPTEYMYID